MRANCERLKGIYSVLENTEEAALGVMSDTYGHALGLDRYYMQALELMKRHFAGVVTLDENNNRVPLKGLREFKEFRDSFSSLSQAFVDAPARTGSLSALPCLRILIAPKEDGYCSVKYQCVGEDK